MRWRRNLVEFFTKASFICFMGDRRIVRTVVVWEASQSCCTRSALCSSHARFHRWFIACIRATLAQLQQIVLTLKSSQATWPSLPWIRRSIAHAVWSACCLSETATTLWERSCRRELLHQVVWRHGSTHC